MTDHALGHRWNRILAAASLTGALGLLLVAWGMLTRGREAWFSYLAALAFFLSIALGGLVFIMIQHAMNGTWFVALRRLAEATIAPLVILAILFLPLLPGLSEVYPWASPLATDPGSEVLHGGRRVYFQLPFFLLRAALYFATWLTTSFLLRRWSVLQSARGGAAFARKQRALSAGLLPLVAFTLTFATFDWLMSLDPLWYSTVFGVYYFAGGVLAFLSLLAVLTELARRGGHLVDDVSVSHVHALGKLMLVFVIFWAYIAFAQLLLIWIADIPAEVTWYAARFRGHWRTVAVLLLIGHFGIPFFALLSWRLKRSGAALAATGAWLLLMHYADIYWLVLPALDPERPALNWLDAAALAGIGGAAITYALLWVRRLPLVPLGDPRLERSRSFHTV